ncbi:hypothetical protein ALQ17_05283 [Pseudomonas fluorescens]|nr:hypothetical protein ALQ17_05283 [Pseudomonas fluorescens]
MLAIGGQRVGGGAAQQARLGAQGEHAHHVQPGADAGVDQYGEVIAHCIGNRRQGFGGGQHAVQLAAAVIGDHDAIGAETHRVLGVLGVEDAFDDHRAFPELADPLQVFPADRRVEIVRQPADVVFQVGGFAQVFGDITQVMGTAHQPHIEGPLRLGDGLQHASLCGERAGHARMGIAIPCTGRGHVHGKYQRRHTGRLRALQRVAHEATVLEHIQLEPDRLRALRRHFFNRAHRHRRQAERDALVRRRLGCLHFTAPRIHAGQADRAEDHRHVEFLAEHRGLQAQVVDIAQDALAQADLGQVRTVRTHRVLGVGAAVDVVEQEAWQLALGGCAVVGGGRDDHF